MGRPAHCIAAKPKSKPLFSSLRRVETRRGGAQDGVQVPKVGLPQEVLRVLQQGRGLLGEVQLRRLQEHPRPELRIPQRHGREGGPPYSPEAFVAAAGRPAAETAACNSSAGKGSAGGSAEDVGGGGGVREGADATAAV